jgi:RNA polymerase sigma factor (sigma-70 family)
VGDDASNTGVLINAVLSGDTQAFKRLIEEYKKLVVHIVFRMVKQERDREDLAQEIFLKVYQNIATFRRECKLSTWIARIAFNTCCNHLEKKQLPMFADIGPEELTIDSFACECSLPDELAEHADMSRRLRDSIDELPPQYGIILTLYHLEEMSYREIGEITEMPEGTVKSYLFRGRRLLKKRLLQKYRVEDLWTVVT